MAVTTSAAFDACNGDDQPSVYVLYVPDLSAYYSTGPVRGLTTSELVVSRPDQPDQQVSLLDGSASLGSMSLTLLNLDGAIDTVLSGSVLKDKTATLYKGFDRMLWSTSTWLQVFTGTISDVERTGDGCGYALSINSNQNVLDVDIFKPEDLAAEVWTGGDKSYDGGSLVLSDSDADENYDTVTLTGNPFTLALKMTISGSGDGSSEDVWPYWAGAAVAASLLKYTAIKAVRDRDWGLVTMRFTFTDSVNVRDFWQTEVLRALGGYPTLGGDGKLGVRLPEVPRSTDDLAEFDDDVILEDAPPRWREDDSLLITHVIVKLDHDGDDFQTTLPPFVSPACLDGDVAPREPHTIESRGLQTDLGGVYVALVVASTLLRRFGTPTRRATFGAFAKMSTTEAGDHVAVASQLWPNNDRPAQLGEGATRLCEVVRSRVRPDRVELDVIELTNFLSGGEKCAVIAPAAAPVYASATDDDKRYAYLANASDGLLPDDEPPYVWS